MSKLCEYEYTEFDFLLVCKHCGRTKNTDKTPETADPRKCRARLDDPEEEVSEPGLLTKAKNYVAAQTSHTLAGRPVCTQEEIDARYAICRVCPFFRDDKCMKCGCNCNKNASSFKNKLAMADAECPLPKPKWTKIKRQDGV